MLCSSGRGARLAAAFALTLAGCGEDGVLGPNLPRELLAGSYRLGELAFDPQGSLPELDAAARLRASGKPDPALTLLPDGTLQLLFEDPRSRLLRLVEGSFRTTPTGAVVDLGSNAAFRSLLLSRSMTLEHSADGTLRFDGPAPDGVERDHLLALNPEWASEPLLGVVPGSLRVSFTKEP